ncbi:FAD-dependent oxidoreductase [soil metagenome]
MKELETDILIVGGGVGGCAAALAACDGGLNVIMTEESDWVGGQFTSQATPPDEHGWIEEFGCTRSYRAFRSRVREFYRMHYPLTPEQATNPFLNPGNGWVSPLCAEPKVFLAVFESMLGEHVRNGNLKILTRTIPTAADVNGDLVRSVLFFDNKTGEEVSVSAKYFVDATELGDLLPLTGTEFVTGSESRIETGEPSAKEDAEPGNSQAFSMCFAMSYHENEDWTIERPRNYEFWRDLVPDLDPPWSGRLLSLTGLSPRTLEPVHYNFQPNRERNKAFAGLWTYRRILHKENFVDGAYATDVTLVNYPQIDYLLGDLCSAERNVDNSGNGEVPARSREQIIDEAGEQSRSFLYYLQTELGFKGLKLRPDIVGTESGLAKMPYIRESRRIKAEFTIKEQHVSAACRPGKVLAERFGDSVGVGFYRIDLHPTIGGDNYIDVESLPFQIPLGAVIPQRTENLLAACKNIGTTHITNGCYRLHPIEWNIGEAAGNLLVFCLSKNVRPIQVKSNAALLDEFQSFLTKQGFELEWPDGLNLDEGDPHRHAA